MSNDTYSIKEALESTETKATVLHAILLNKYGPEFYGWDLLTISMEVRDDFGAVMSSESGNRIAAMQLVMESDAFFKSMDAFLSICDTLSEGEPFFNVFDPATVEEICWAIAEISLNRPMEPFSYAIRKYIRIMLQEEGYGEEYPEFLEAVFKEDDKDHDDIVKEVKAIRSNPNDDNLSEYIDGELQVMVVQFNDIPSIQDIDNFLFKAEGNTIVDTL